MNRTRISAAVIAALAALTLGACGTGELHDTAAGRPEPSVTATTPATTPATPSPSQTTSAPPVTPTPTPTPAPTTHRPRPTHPATTRPAVRRTTAPPAVRHTTSPPAPRPSVCSIRSNAGNCYKAGQFCRNADLGLSTTDAEGRRITCVMQSGRPHWHY